MKPGNYEIDVNLLFFQVECYMVAGDGSIGKSQFDVLHHQHLAGEG